MEKSVFDSELEMVRTAVFLNPQEEATWNFYKWMVRKVLPCRVIEIKQAEEGWRILFCQQYKNPTCRRGDN
jgi:hypothetical protein